MMSVKARLTMYMLKIVWRRLVRATAIRTYRKIEGQKKNYKHRKNWEMISKRKKEINKSKRSETDINRNIQRTGVRDAAKIIQRRT